MMEGRPGRQFSGGKLMRQPWIEMYLLTHMRPAGMERVEGENVVIWRNSSMQRGGSFHCQVIDVEIQDGTIILADGCHSILAKLTKECREDLDPEKLGYRFETLSGKLIIPQVFSIHARRTFTNVCVTLHVRKLQVWGGEGQFLRNPIDSIGLSKAVNSRLLALNITPIKSGSSPKIDRVTEETAFTADVSEQKLLIFAGKFAPAGVLKRMRDSKGGIEVAPRGNTEEDFKNSGDKSASAQDFAYRQSSGSKSQASLESQALKESVNRTGRSPTTGFGVAKRDGRKKIPGPVAEVFVGTKAAAAMGRDTAHTPVEDANKVPCNTVEPERINQTTGNAPTAAPSETSNVPIWGGPAEAPLQTKAVDGDAAGVVLPQSVDTVAISSKNSGERSAATADAPSREKVTRGASLILPEPVPEVPACKSTVHRHSETKSSSESVKAPSHAGPLVVYDTDTSRTTCSSALALEQSQAQQGKNGKMPSPAKVPSTSTPNQVVSNTQKSAVETPRSDVADVIGKTSPSDRVDMAANTQTENSPPPKQVTSNNRESFLAAAVNFMRTVVPYSQSSQRASQSATENSSSGAAREEAEERDTPATGGKGSERSEAMDAIEVTQVDGKDTLEEMEIDMTVEKQSQNHPNMPVDPNRQFAGLSVWSGQAQLTKLRQSGLDGSPEPTADDGERAREEGSQNDPPTRDPRNPGASTPAGPANDKRIGLEEARSAGVHTEEHEASRKDKSPATSRRTTPSTEVSTPTRSGGSRATGRGLANQQKLMQSPQPATEPIRVSFASKFKTRATTERTVLPVTVQMAAEPMELVEEALCVALTSQVDDSKAAMASNSVQGDTRGKKSADEVLLSQRSEAGRRKAERRSAKKLRFSDEDLRTVASPAVESGATEKPALANDDAEGNEAKISQVNAGEKSERGKTVPPEVVESGRETEASTKGIAQNAQYVPREQGEGRSRSSVSDTILPAEPRGESTEEEDAHLEPPCFSNKERAGRVIGGRQPWQRVEFNAANPLESLDLSNKRRRREVLRPVIRGASRILRGVSKRSNSLYGRAEGTRGNKGDAEEKMVASEKVKKPVGDDARMKHPINEAIGPVVRGAVERQAVPAARDKESTRAMSAPADTRQLSQSSSGRRLSGVVFTNRRGKARLQTPSVHGREVSQVNAGQVEKETPTLAESEASMLLSKKLAPYEKGAQQLEKNTPPMRETPPTTEEPPQRVGTVEIHTEEKEMTSKQPQSTLEEPARAAANALLAPSVGNVDNRTEEKSLSSAQPLPTLDKPTHTSVNNLHTLPGEKTQENRSAPALGHSKGGIAEKPVEPEMEQSTGRGPGEGGSALPTQGNRDTDAKVKTMPSNARGPFSAPVDTDARGGLTTPERDDRLVSQKGTSEAVDGLSPSMAIETLGEADDRARGDDVVEKSRLNESLSLVKETQRESGEDATHESVEDAGRSTNLEKTDAILSIETQKDGMVRAESRGNVEALNNNSELEATTQASVTPRDDATEMDKRKEKGIEEKRENGDQVRQELDEPYGRIKAASRVLPPSFRTTPAPTRGRAVESPDEESKKPFERKHKRKTTQSSGRFSKRLRRSLRERSDIRKNSQCTVQ